jgi:hypothetical protein
MNAGTIKRAGLLNGVAIKSTADLPYINWMSVHGRDLAQAARYERKCRICKEDADLDGLKARIGGLTVHLRANTLTNGLMVATIHDCEGGLVCNANEYGGITPIPNAKNRDSIVYVPVARTARLTRNANLGNGFTLLHLDADANQGTIYNRIRRECPASEGRSIILEYSILHHESGVVELLEFQCTVTRSLSLDSAQTGKERTERLVIDADGEARVNQALIDGKVDGKTKAVRRLKFNAKKVVAEIAGAVAAEADFTLEDMGKWHPILYLKAWIERRLAA